MSTIDLNADLGEGADDEAIYVLVSSANIACGGHAGDEATMALALRRAAEHGVAAGAHPSFPDRDGFGRVSVRMDPASLSASVEAQIRALAHVALTEGVRLTHVKPHGALYNDAARDADIAAAVADAVLRVSRDLVLVGLAGSVAITAWRSRGLTVAPEGFCDRGYDATGMLLPRTRPGAVLTDPDVAAAQALRLAREGQCRTLCVHSDTPGAVHLLAAIRKTLERAGWEIAAPHR